MRKPNKKRTRRIRNLIVLCTFSAIILTVSTYAWFIGMRTVNVNPFQVEIASTDSLMLSLNGSKWTSTINISEDTLNDVSYSGHTNNWGGEGLIPMSSVGEMDDGASRMKLFEKASLTPTKGGYRLLASRVNNFDGTDPERNGYVVFDLFVRNYTGTQYIVPLNEADEEAIYLTTDSEVTVATDGVKDTGIENSVRVAFTQIGRVSGTTTDAGNITGITCANARVCADGTAPTTSEACSTAHGSWTEAVGETPGKCTGTSDEYCEAIGGTMNDVTGICRDAQIWEPNDTKHVDDAIRWYNTACLKRLAAGTDVTVATSYAGSCETIVDGTAYATYAVKTAITASDNVDVYDGASYNTYANSSTKNLLHAYDYFTDTEKMLTGTARPQFMTLAPNSITKLRIYIYIEGQDVDNYDFASIGRKISVKFGFTKERFEEDDIQYVGPNTPTVTGVCTGGNPAPATEVLCEAAHGKWNANTSTCNADTYEYCTAIGGDFLPYRATGVCTGSTNVPTTKATCEAADGTWAAETCSGNTYRYCIDTEGTFTAFIATGTCDGTAPTTKATCETAFGTWDGTTCTGDTFKYCNAITGTFTDYKTVGTCTNGDVPTTQTACEAADGTWAAETCSGTTNRYCSTIGGTFVAD